MALIFISLMVSDDQHLFHVSAGQERVIYEMNIKAILRCHLIHVRIASSKYLQITNVSLS